MRALHVPLRLPVEHQAEQEGRGDKASVGEGGLDLVPPVAEDLLQCREREKNSSNWESAGSDKDTTHTHTPACAVAKNLSIRGRRDAVRALQSLRGRKSSSERGRERKGEYLK